MSIEQLLFLLFLLAFPLLERLTRALRSPRSGSAVTRQPLPAPAEATGSRGGSAVSVADATTTEAERREVGQPDQGPVAPALLPPPIPRVVTARLRASERERPARRSNQRQPVAALAARHTRRPLLDRRPIDARDLSRAIVLIAVLGPCRALEGKDASQVG